jgi:hypothetical protein
MASFQGVCADIPMLYDGIGRFRVDLDGEVVGSNVAQTREHWPASKPGLAKAFRQAQKGV